MKKPIVLTKRDIHLPPANHYALPLDDYVHSFRRSIHSSWQFLWDHCITDDSKLAQLKISLGPCSSCFHRCRRLEVSFSRLHIGHARLTHGHLMACEAPSICSCCQVRLSVFHVLVECPAFSVPCNWFFSSLTSLLPLERLSLLSQFPTFSSSKLYIF